MDHIEMNIIDENKPNIIRKKSLFLRDSSYRIFHITKKSKEDSDDDDDNRNIHKKNDIKNNKIRKKSLKMPNRNGLKQILFLHKTSCELSSIEAKDSPSSHHKTNELSQSVICDDETTVKLLEMKNKQHVEQERTTNWSNKNAINKVITFNTILDRADKFQTKRRKQVFINIHPEIQASFHRRRKRFIVACGTVLVALTVIITIIIYVIIMTIKQKTKMNEFFFNYPGR